MNKRRRYKAKARRLVSRCRAIIPAWQVSHIHVGSWLLVRGAAHIVIARDGFRVQVRRVTKADVEALHGR